MTDAKESAALLLSGLQNARLNLIQRLRTAEEGVAFTRNEIGKCVELEQNLETIIRSAS